jgi:hypothetical protein
MNNDTDKNLIRELIDEDRQLRTALTNAPPPEPSGPNIPEVTQSYQANIKAEVRRAAERAKLNIHRAFNGESCLTPAIWAKMEDEVDAEAEAAAEAARASTVTEIKEAVSSRLKNKRELIGWDRPSLRRCHKWAQGERRRKAGVRADRGSQYYDKYFNSQIARKVGYIHLLTSTTNSSLRSRE